MNNKRKKKYYLLLIILLFLFTSILLLISIFKIEFDIGKLGQVILSSNNFKNEINPSLVQNPRKNNIVNSLVSIDNIMEEVITTSVSQIVSKSEKKVVRKVSNATSSDTIASKAANTFEQSNSSIEEDENIEIVNNSIYCWSEYVLSSDYIDMVIKRLKSLKVTKMYISIKDIESRKNSIRKLNSNGISVYYLDGHSRWYREVDNIKGVVDKVYEYNQNNPNTKLSGIVLDIEPYIRDEYKVDPIPGFETFANTMEQVYSYTTLKNINLTTTIPYWYDKYMTDDKYTADEKVRAELSFDKLIKNSDRISVMNYYKSKMISHLETELKYAKKYEKEIESIAEFRESSSGDNNKLSFYNESEPVKAANKEWQKINKEYNYDKLSFSFHHLNAILEIYNEVKRYKFEFIDENSNVVTSGRYNVLLSNGENIEKSVISDAYLLPNATYDVSLKNYDISSYDGEEVLNNGTIKKTYHVLSKEKYQLEIYARYSDDSRISDGTMKLINTETNEELTAECDGTSGYFSFRHIYSNVAYKVVYVDYDGNEKLLESATAKNNDSVYTNISDNGNIIIPRGFKTSLYISPKFIIKKIELPPESYFLELYPKLWNGSRYASVREGYVKMINNTTGEETTNNIRGTSSEGFYTYFTVTTGTNYTIRILDLDGNDLGHTVVGYKYKDANNVEQNVNDVNDIFNLPNGLNSPLYPTVYFE